MRAVAAAVVLAAALAPRANADCELSDFLDVPVKVADLWAVAEVKINGHPARMIIDSGSSDNNIDAVSAQAFGLEMDIDPKFVAQGSNGEFREQMGTAREFEMAGYKIKNVAFMIGGAQIGGGVQGLLGQELLSAADIDFDYGAGFVRFVRPKDCGGQALAYWAKPDQFFGMVEVRSSDPDLKDITGVAEVNGVKVRVLFDTGGGDSTLSLAAAKRAGISPTDPGAVDAGDLGGLGRKRVATWVVPVKSFAIGGEEIRNTKLRIGDWTGADRTYADMILGGDFFVSHHVYLANSQHRIYFTYNGGPVFDLTAKPAAAAAK
jgi:predicted aspartyl protease